MAGNASAGNANSRVDYRNTMTDSPTAIGLLGTATSATSLLISLLPHITATVQFATALVGLLVAILTAIYMSRKLKGQNNENP